MFATLAAAAVAATLALPQASAEPSADSLLKSLQRGGYTIVLRHARTDRTSRDEANYSNTDRFTQRNLSGAGVADARAIGLVMKDAGIRFSEILSSPMFRTKETAEMAFGEPTLTQLLRELQPSPAQRELLIKAPAAGTNRAIVTHHFLIEQHVPGIKPGDIGESEAVVVRRGNQGQVELVGRFKLNDWARLSGGKTGNADAPAGHTPPAGTPAVLPAGVTPFEWQATAATRLAGMYLHTFNTGDAEQMRAYTDMYLVVDPNRTTAQRVEAYKSLFQNHGAFSIVGTVSATEQEAVILVKSKQGDIRLMVTVSETDPKRAASIRMASMQGHP